VPRDTQTPIRLTEDDLLSTRSDDPCRVWDALREQGPIHRIMTPEGTPAWLVTRHADVRSGLLDPRLSVRKECARGGDYKGFALPAALDAHLLNRDPPDHTRLRELIAPALQPRRIEPFRTQIEEITDDLIDRFAPTGRADLVADLAVPLPLLVVCALLGVSDRDADRLLGWARKLLAVAEALASEASDHELATWGPRDADDARLLALRPVAVARHRRPGDAQGCRGLCTPAGGTEGVRPGPGRRSRSRNGLVGAGACPADRSSRWIPARAGRDARISESAP
jgi:cytochrome P450